MNNGYILWLTGMEPLLRRAVSSGESVDPESVYFEIGSAVADALNIRNNLTAISRFRFGWILESNSMRVAIIAAEVYSPQQMHRDIIEQCLTHVVFLRTPRQFTRQRYVEVAADMNFSFFKQQLPDPILLPGNTSRLPTDTPEIYPYTPEGLTSFLNIKIDRSTHITINGDMNGGNINTGKQVCQTLNESGKSRKSWKEYATDLLINIIGGLVTNCGFFSALSGS